MLRAQPSAHVNSDVLVLVIFSMRSLIHRVRKKEATLFSTTTLAFLGRFLYFLYH